MIAGGVANFTSSLLANDESLPVVLFGSGLDPSSERGSVRGIRFELASSCTAGAQSNNSVIDVGASALGANEGNSILTIPLSGTGGFSVGRWSVCVDWSATAETPTYARVGTSNAYVQVGSFSSSMIFILFFFFTVLKGFSCAILTAGGVSDFTPTVLVNDASQVVTISGVGLDPDSIVGSVRSVRFENALTCTASGSSNNTIVTPVFGQVSTNAAKTLLVVPLAGTSGLSGGLWSVCIDWTAFNNSDLYVRVGNASAVISVGEWEISIELIE